MCREEAVEQPVKLLFTMKLHDVLDALILLLLFFSKKRSNVWGDLVEIWAKKSCTVSNLLTTGKDGIFLVDVSTVTAHFQQKVKAGMLCTTSIKRASISSNFVYETK